MRRTDGTSRRSRRWFPGIALLAGLVLLVAACETDDPDLPEDVEAPDDGEEPDEDVADDDMVLRLGMGSDAESLDPPNFVLTADFQRMDLIYNTLVGLDENLDIQPELATDWEEVDETTWRFELRDDVVFHDGTEMDAEGVATVLERSAGEPQGEGFLGMIESVDAVEDHTIEVNLERQFSPLLQNLAAPVAGIYSPAALEEMGDDLATDPVGSGPYELRQWNPDDRLVLDRFDDYWGDDAPELDTIEFLPIPESGTRFSALQTGEVDVIENPSPDEVPTMEADDDLEVILEPRGRPVFLGFNLEEVDDLDVRRAIAHAIDKEALVESILGGVGEPATQGLIPPAFVDQPGEDLAIPYDPDAAEELLADVNETSFRLVVPTERYLRDQEMAEAIQAQLADVGVDVDLDVRETGAWFDALLNRDTELYWLGWGVSVPDPLDTFTRVFTSEQVNNMSQLANPQIDEWVLEMERLEPGTDQRAEIVADIQREIVVEEVAVVPIYYMVNFYGARAEVENFRTSPLEYLDLTDTTVNR